MTLAFVILSLAGALLTGCATTTTSSSVLQGKVISGEVGIELTVSDADPRLMGPGIAGAAIRLSTLQESSVPIAKAVSGDDGSFTIALTPAQANRNMRLLVKADGFVPLRDIATLPVPAGKQLLILLEPLKGDRQEQGR